MTKTNMLGPALMAAALILFGSTLKAGPYDSTALRGPMADLPQFQTNLGREGHRFADASINEYRLYDFYARQARYQLAQEGNLQEGLLLPYPGLEGGRHGHWGVSNEKQTSAVLHREQEPRYTRLVNRGATANQFLCLPTQGTQALCLFEGMSPALSKVILDVDLVTPEFAFSSGVDRFGFDLNFTGQDYLLGHGAEWHTSSSEATGVINDGYYLYQDSVVFRRFVGPDQVPLLDQPMLSYDGDIAVFTRALEWCGDAPAQLFLLPEAADELANAEVSIQRRGKTWFAVITGDQRRLSHRVTSSADGGDIELIEQAGKLWVSFPPCASGTRIEISSWVSPPGDEEAEPPVAVLPTLSELSHGGQRHFGDSYTLEGTLDADPAASRTSYVIDDIPVPVDKTYGMPMTTCGLAFAEDGTAYVSTLVGDVWKVTGLDASLKEVTWQKFASGLNNPLGLEWIDGVVYVITQHQLLQLIDLNEDGEADLVKPLSRVPFPPNYMQDLARDGMGNFYSSNVTGIQRLSADGSSLETISEGSRNPLGLAVRADGLALSDSSEGPLSNGACTIFESSHPENEHSVAKHKRILYLPRGIDNSPASRLFMDSPRFGPLGQSILGLSYGQGRIYQILRDPNFGSPQAALRLLPGELPSGSTRLATNPADGQVYIVGFDGWGDYAVVEGSLSRLRYTAEEPLIPLGWSSYSNGLSVRFNKPIDPASIQPSSLFVQQWNYIDSQNTYGSTEYSVKIPDQIGHDRLRVDGIEFSSDYKEMFINIAEILPAMSTQIYAQLRSADGLDLEFDLYATINQLSDRTLAGVPPLPAGKNLDLEVPYKDNNGDTYENLVRFFDQHAGRDLVDRPLGPVADYQPEDLDYAWVRDNIITANNCIACHGAGQAVDFSSYESLSNYLVPGHPETSHLSNMVETGSMPPYPMPAVAPEMIQALREWIEMEAPE